MIQSFKTKRQMRCNPMPDSKCQVSNCVETRLSVSLGIMLHKTTRSKSLINTLYDINMLISYKVACIKQNVAETVRRKVQDSSGLFIPSCFFSSHLTTRIEKLVHQMTSDSYMVLRWSSFKKVKPKFTNKKWKPEEVQGYGIFIEMFEILLLFVVSTL